MMMQRQASFSNLSISSGRRDRNQSTASIASTPSKEREPMVTMTHTASMESIKDCHHCADVEREYALETKKAMRGPRRRYPMLEEVGRLPSRIDLDDEGDGDEIQNDALLSLLGPQQDDTSSQGDASSTYLGREDDCLTHDDPSSDDSSSDGDASSTYLGREDDYLTHDDPSSDDDSSSDGDASSTYLGREDDCSTHDEPKSDDDSSSDGDASSTYLGRGDDCSTHDDPSYSYLGQEDSDSSSDGDASSTYLGKDDPSSYDDPNLLDSSSSDDDDDSIDAELCYESHPLAWEPYQGKTKTTLRATRNGNDNRDNHTLPQSPTETASPLAKSSSRNTNNNDNIENGTSRVAPPITKSSSTTTNNDNIENGTSRVTPPITKSNSNSGDDGTSRLTSTGAKTTSSSSNNENGTSRLTSPVATVSNNDNDDQDFVMEVAPNVFKTIRGANRVIRAWKNGDCIEALCFACDIRLACTDDCEGVVCPTCLSVSPVEGHRSGAGESFIGIGLRID